MISRIAFFNIAAAGIFALTCASAAVFQSAETYSLAEAKKVLQSIEKIKAESGSAVSSGGRNIELTESELNSYFAYRIDTEKSDVLKELELKIFDKNRLEGKIFIDLSGRNIPSFIKPRMTVLFSADVVVDAGKGKLEIKELYLEYQKIQPKILDGILRLAEKLSGLEPVGLEDWFDLPTGVKDIKTRKGFAIFYY